MASEATGTWGCFFLGLKVFSLLLTHMLMIASHKVELAALPHSLAWVLHGAAFRGPSSQTQKPAIALESLGCWGHSARPRIPRVNLPVF